MTSDRNRRQALLEAASQEFGTKGFAGSRVDAIARAAGVNKQLIFYYFGSKRGLFEATVEQAPASDDPDAPGTGPATDQLRTAVRAIIEGFDRDPSTRVALLDPLADAATTARQLEQLERPVVAAISTGQGLGYFRDGADPALIGRQAVVLCAGWHATHGAAGPQDAWLDGTVDTLLRALAW